jgi:hypothetical protein
MNWKLISLLSLGFGSLCYGLISSAADNHLSKNVGEMAVQQRAEGVDEDLKWANDNIKRADEIRARESKEIFDGVKAWKKQTNYDGQIRDIHMAHADELRTFRESINYDTRRQEFDDEYEDALDSFKESIDFDYEIDLANAEIRDAEAQYKRRCKRIDIASGGDDDELSDALKDAKKEAKEQMDETVKDAKSKITSLKNKVSNEENKLNRKRQASIRELDAELQPTKLRLQKSEQEACKILEDERIKATDGIREEVTRKRTEDEQKALDWYDESQTVISSQKRKDAELARDIYESTPEHKKWAGYLKDNGVPKFFVVAIGALPLIPTTYLVWKYVKFIWDVVRAM